MTAPTDTQPILRATDVRKHDGQVQALGGVSLDVSRGEVVCLIGPSGSGKSTLLRTLNALEPIDGRQVVFDGIDVHARRTDLHRVRQLLPAPENFPGTWTGTAHPISCPETR